MALVTLTYPLTDNTTAFGSQVRANDDAIVAQVNGGLEDINIKTGAAISGLKLSNVAGSRVPTDRIEDVNVTTAKLADGAVTNAKLGALAVTKDKLTTAGGQKITVAQLELASGSGAVTIPQVQVCNLAAGGVSANRVVSASVAPVNVAGNWQFRCMGSHVEDSGDLFVINDATIDPNAVGIGTLPVATKQIIGCWLVSPSLSGTSIVGTLYVVYLNVS